jgi:outer membrane protein OmpA-like peptidoglycan-associated protein
MKRTAMVMLVFAALSLTTRIAVAQVAAAVAGDQVAAAAAPMETPAIPATAVLQNITAPTYADVNCAGFITSEPPSEKTYVSGGWDTPHDTKYADREYVYLSGGGVQVNSLYTILRHLQDPNKYPAFKDQTAVAASSGEPYAEIGHVRVVAVRGQNVGVAQIEYSCEPIVPGDFAVPFVEKPAVTLPHTIMFDRFASPNGKAIGQIVLGKDFDQFLGTGKKAYINIGADKGLKVGDYLRATRTYEEALKNEGDSVSYRAIAKSTATEDTQKDPTLLSTSRLGELPRRTLGEMVVLGVYPHSATVMIATSISDVMVGDHVELMDGPLLPPPPPPPPMNPPTISCQASPVSVRKGESSSVTCDVASPDNRQVSLSFSTSSGRITPRENTALLDTGTADTGQVTVVATATDDRNLSSTAQATVNVAGAAGPPAATNNEVQFAKGSARVDNKAKAILDGVALLMQQQADSTAVVIGMPDSDSKTGAKLAMARAENVKKYLTASKGIDATRIQTRAGTKTNGKAEVWVVPAGAPMP